MDPASTMGSGDLGKEVDLKALIEALKAEHNQLETNFSNPSMVTIRFHEGDPAITLYRTGGFQIRGTKDKADLNATKDELFSKLGNIGFDVTEANFDHRNTVFLASLDDRVQLEQLALQLGLENVEYEPEQFPGMVYRHPESQVVQLIFGSGKVIITGTTEEKVAHEALDDLRSAVQ